MLLLLLFVRVYSEGFNAAGYNKAGFDKDGYGNC